MQSTKGGEEPRQEQEEQPVSVTARLKCGLIHLLKTQERERLTGSGPGSNSQGLSPPSSDPLPIVDSTF